MIMQNLRMNTIKTKIQHAYNSYKKICHQKFILDLLKALIQTCRQIRMSVHMNPGETCMAR
jgi:HKD family nuclease